MVGLNELVSTVADVVHPSQTLQLVLPVGFCLRSVSNNYPYNDARYTYRL